MSEQKRSFAVGFNLMISSHLIKEGIGSVKSVIFKPLQTFFSFSVCLDIFIAKYWYKIMYQDVMAVSHHCKFLQTYSLYLSGDRLQSVALVHGSHFA